jgi:dihydroorotase
MFKNFNGKQSMKKQCITNVRIIDPKNSLDEIGGILINEQGKIEAIGKKVSELNASDATIYNCPKKIAIPGIIDMRVFVGEPGFEYKENFRTLSQAAISGGVTAAITMPNTNPVVDNVSTLDFIKRRSRDKSIIKIFPLASLTKNTNGEDMTEFGLLKLRGAWGFTDGLHCVQNNKVMDKILNYAKNKDALIVQFPQDNELSKNGVIHEGFLSTKLGLKGIPDIAEQIIIERDLRLLEQYNGRYHISLLSSKKSLEIIKSARARGLKFTVGVSINNLSLNDNDIGDFRTFLKLSPPLRSEDDRIALIEAVEDGTIDVIVSDHKPEDEESKRLTFQQAATGASGIETLLALSLELVHNEKCTLNTIIKSLTSNPAEILGLRNGTLSVGSEADIAIFDLQKPWVLNKENIKSKSKNTAIEKRKLQGKVEKTFINGKLVFSE